MWYDCGKGRTAMSDVKPHSQEPETDQEVWRKQLTKVNAEIASSATLTEEEKRFLLEEMDQLSDNEWEPIVCSGDPISETIMNDRGER